MEEANSRKNKNKKKQRNRTILYLLMGVFLVIYTLFWKAYFEVQDTTTNIYNQISTNNKRESDVTLQATQPISFAFLGIDNGRFGRGTDVGRSDAILIGTVNPKTKKTTLVSVPRDTYALMDGYQTDYGSPYYDKIAHAYAFGDADMAINSIQELLNFPIDYYVEVNMQGLVDIVNVLGGIEITSPLTFDYQGSYFYEGETRTLDGQEALSFARMRKDDLQGDFGRQQREKMVVRAIIDAILDLESIANYQSILETLEENVRTNLTFKDMTAILKAYGSSLEEFEQDGLVGEELWLDEVYYFYVNPEERLDLSNRLREELELSQIDLDDMSLSDVDYMNIEYVGEEY